jgi:two-component system, OmpR family, response regulator
MRILLVEDEPEMARLIVEWLHQFGFDADHVATIGKARESIGAHSYSLALLDRRLPDGDGVSLIKDIRRTHPGIRVLMLTALDSVSDKIMGLDAGADDYLPKPFDIDELLARIRANLRRSGAGAGAQPPMTVAALSFDVESREIFVSGRPIMLHRRELALLESLVRRQGRATPRDTLVEEVYGGECELQSNALDALVSRLRRHLNENDAGVAIHPIRGVGYMLTKSMS